MGGGGAGAGANRENLEDLPMAIERFHSLIYANLLKRKKALIYIRIEFKYHRIGLECQHGRRFIVLEHQYRHRDVRETLYSSEF